MCYIDNKTYTFVTCQHLTNCRSYLLPHLLQSNRDLEDNAHGCKALQLWRLVKCQVKPGLQHHKHHSYHDKISRYKKLPSIPLQLGCHCYFFFKMRSHLTQADLKLSIQLRPWRSVYSRKKDLESKMPGVTLYRGIIISLKDRTDKHTTETFLSG